jgi:tetratricopeptide (TPR) repeat protein
MSFKTVLRSAGAALAVLTIGASGALAQTCDITELSSAVGEKYLLAQNELVVNDNPAAASAGLAALRGEQLNCYEEGAVLGLSAQIKLAQEDYLGAARDLRTSLDKGYIPVDQRGQTLKALSQIYFAENQYDDGLRFMNEWIAAGGQPTRDEKWTLASVYALQDKYREAVPWAEQVLAADGANADRAVYDMLIYLYSNTGQLAKKAALLERLIERDPTDKQLWQAIAGDYFQADNQRRAFEVQKTMYLGGILTEETEIMQVVNFYNSFDVPYAAARILEKEMNAGRVSRSFERLELLAQLYQVAREHERAIPVLTEAARMNNSADLYLRLGRSYLDQKEWEKAEEALTSALNAGGLRDRGLAWTQIGQTRYERDDRAGAREAFAKANDRTGRSWLAFMDSEERTAKARIVEVADNERRELVTEQDACKTLTIIGGENLPEGCATIDERLAAATAKVVELQETL